MLAYEGAGTLILKGGGPHVILYELAKICLVIDLNINISEVYLTRTFPYITFKYLFEKNDKYYEILRLIFIVYLITVGGCITFFIF